MRHVRLLALVAVVLLPLIGRASVAHAAGGGTSYTWIGNSAGPGDNHSWGDPGNWWPDGVPGDGDSVNIVQPDAEHCAAHVDGMPAVSLVDFTLTDDPSMCSASLAGAGLTVTGTLSWNGGTLNVPTTITSGATGTVNGSSGRLSELWQNLDVEGRLTLTNLVGDQALKITDPNVLHVHPGAELVSSGSNEVTYSACCTTPARIVNDGTLRVNGGTLSVAAVEVDQNGTLATTSHGRLVTTLAPLTASDGAKYTGDGRWTIQDRADALFSGTQSLGPDFHLELGGLSVNSGSTLGGTATLGGSGTFDWTGGTIEANLTIAHGVHVMVSGAHTDNGRRALWGTDYLSSKTPAATVTNHGSIIVNQGAGIDTLYTARLVNAADGSLVLGPGTRIGSGRCCTSPDRIVNYGKVVVPSGASTAPVVITNIAYRATGGTTTIAGGRQLRLVGGAPNWLHSTAVAGGGTLYLMVPTSLAGSVLIGSHTRIALLDRDLDHGSLYGTATVAGAGALSWMGGALSGHLTLKPTGGIAISGKATKTIANINGGYTPSQVVLASHTSIAAGTAKAHDLIDLGYSTLTLAAATTAGNHVELYGGKLVNTGTLVIAAGSTGRVDRTGSTSFLNRKALAVRSGTLAVQGSFRQAAGTTTVARGATLLVDRHWVAAFTGGALSGAGTVRAAVSNSGATVKPGGTGIGTLRIAGPYTQGSKAALGLDLGARSHDVLAVAGAVTLRGRLVGHNVSGYRPRAGARQVVVTSARLSGSPGCTVSSGTGSTGRGAGHWEPSRSAGRLVLVRRPGAHTHC